jgi:cytochrome c2
MQPSFKSVLVVAAVTTILMLADQIALPSAPAGVPSAEAQSKPAASGAVAKVSGDVNAGRSLFASKGCIACHVAQGVPGAVGTIGPSLNGLGDAGKRPQLASGEPNTPANIRGWIKDPQARKPGTLMPNLGLSDKESDDLTAFLVTLR